MRFSDSSLAGGVLIAASAVVLVLATLTDRGDLTSATLFLSGISTFIAGVFAMTLGRGEPVDPEIAGLLPVAGSIDISRIAADLGVAGDAWCIPRNGGLIELIPVDTGLPESLPAETTFLTGDQGNGLLLVPAGAPLLQRLEKRNMLVLPSDEPGLLAAVKEVFLDVLEVADRVTAVRDGDSIIVELVGFRFFSGCEEVRSESPRCCTLHPCPVCSLSACMLAKGTGRATALSHVIAERRKKSIRILLVQREWGPGPAGTTPAAPQAETREGPDEPGPS